LVEEGVSEALRAYREGRVPDEPRLVERMLTNIEHSIRGANIGGLRWEAGTLSSSGKRPAESQFGADFLGVFEVDVPEYRVAKGFFAQAKLIRDGDQLGAAERNRLREQCTRMLAHTPDSFAFVLQPHAATIVPAISIVAGDNEPLRLYQRGVQHFFEEHFACFIGDGLFAAPNVRALDALPELRDRYDARHVLYIAASTDPGGVADRLNALGARTRRRPPGRR
jgi:hypothetical protein